MERTRAWAAQRALEGRGFDSLDDLEPVAQARFAQGLGVPLAELRGALGDRRGPGGHGRGGPLAAERERELAELRAGPQPDPVLEAMLQDERVWGEVTRAARALHVPVTGARSTVHGHVTRALDRLRKRWLEHDPAVSEDSYRWVQRTRRQMREAESAHRETQMAKSQALVSLERQAAAVLGAARMSGR